MKVRTTIAGTPLRARLTALCWGALTLLAPVAISACGGSSSSPTVPTFTPTVSISGSITAPASGASSTSPDVGTSSAGTPGASSSSPVDTATGVATATVTTTVTEPAPTPTSGIPTAAPPTGGGGTAGLQDGLLFVLGVAAILIGAGSILYRKRLTRRR